MGEILRQLSVNCQAVPERVQEFSDFAAPDVCSTAVVSDIKFTSKSVDVALFSRLLNSFRRVGASEVLYHRLKLQIILIFEVGFVVAVFKTGQR